jgi:hypothetical protein
MKGDFVMPRHDEMDSFVRDVIAQAHLDGRSQDITLNVFNALRDIPALRSRYITMGGRYRSDLNDDIGMAVKRVLKKENLERTELEHEFIQSYQRYRPEA